MIMLYIFFAVLALIYAGTFLSLYAISKYPEALDG